MKLTTKKMLKSILSLVLVLSLLVGCSMMFVGCSSSNDGGGETQAENPKHDPSQYEGLNDQEYLQTLGYNYLSDATAALAKAYNAYTGKSTSSGAKVDMTLTLGDPVLDMMEDAAGGSMDFGFLSKVNMSMDVGTKDQLTQAKVALGLNDKDIATVTMLMDMANYAVYMGIPELNSTYIKADMMSYLASSGADIESMTGAINQLYSALPDGETMETILNRYIKIALAELDDVKRTASTLEVNGISQECGKMTVKIHEKDVLDIGEKVITELKKDKDVKKIIEDVVKAAADISGESVDADTIYSQFQDAMDEALDMIEETKETADDEYIELVVYLDEVHSVIGLSLAENDDEPAVYYYTATDGEKTAMEMVLDGVYAVDMNGNVKKGEPALEISGTGTTKNGKSSGTYTVKTSGTEILTVETKDMTAESGTITLKPSEEIMNNSFSQLPFEDIALEIKLQKDGIELNAMSGSKKLVGISMTVKESSISSVKLPTKYVNATDSSALMDWVSDAKFDTIISNLKKAGVPSELTDLLEMYVG